MSGSTVAQVFYVRGTPFETVYTVKRIYIYSAIGALFARPSPRQVGTFCYDSSALSRAGALFGRAPSTLPMPFYVTAIPAPSLLQAGLTSPKSNRGCRDCIFSAAEKWGPIKTAERIMRPLFPPHIRDELSVTFGRVRLFPGRYTN